MDTLMDLWQSTWNGYAIDPIYIYLAVAVAAVLAYRDWQRTLLVVWVVVYAWSMGVALTSPRIDLSEGFLVVWVAGYGLFGFFMLGFLFYSNLKQ